MSRKHNSSAPAASYAIAAATGSPASRRLTKLTPLTTRPSLTSRQGMTRTLNICDGTVKNPIRFAFTGYIRRRKRRSQPRRALLARRTAPRREKDENARVYQTERAVHQVQGMDQDRQTASPTQPLSRHAISLPDLRRYAARVQADLAVVLDRLSAI